MILSFFFHFYSLVILLVSLFFSCFRYIYVFTNFIGDIFKIIVKRYWIALEIALYKFIIIIIMIISMNHSFQNLICNFTILEKEE